MRRFNWFNTSQSLHKRKLAVHAESAPDLEGKQKDDARALELIRIFSDAEPIAFQGKLERRTVR